MKKTQQLKWRIAAGLGLAGLLIFSTARAANITWGATGTFNDNSVLALAGTPANEVYGVDFGAGAQTTANGYNFADVASGNMSIAGSLGSYNGYKPGPSTGDAAFDSLVANGGYGGSANTGTLNNLTVGNYYTVLALLCDERNAAGGTTFFCTDGVTSSSTQQYHFVNGSPSVGGYILGTFTATATTQAFTVRNGGSSQYNAILLISNAPPVAPLPVLLTNTQPASATVGIGDQMVFTAAFSNSPPVSLQWQVVANGATNNVNTGVVNATNSGVVTSTLTLVNLQLSNAGSYQLKAVNATNSAGVAYSLGAPLTVVNPIQWVKNGTFTDNTVLTLAGAAANEVYGVDFGAGSLTTANGYNFTDAWDGSAVTGNMSVSGTAGDYNQYLFTGSTGDGALDALLTFGIYNNGPANAGTLNNLTVGQTYNVLVLLDDTRTYGSPQNGQDPETYFRATDGAYVSQNQTFSFPQGTNTLTGVPTIGGYVLGTFTAASTNQSLSAIPADVFGNYGLNSQYNAILLVTGTPPVLPPIYLAADTTPAYATRVLGAQPSPLTLPQGSNLVFTAAFRNINPSVNLQWQVISTNGVTNNVNVGVVNVTNNSIVTSTLTLSNLQLSVSGNSYLLKAVNATNSTDVAYSTAVPLTVVPTIIWGATGTFDNNSVLALAGTPANEVYGVDFGAGAQTTANGYTFSDYATSGNMSIAGGGFGLYNAYMEGGATTGDAALDTLLTFGLYGSAANTGTLNNLTVGQAYNVLALLDDTRSAPGGSPTFTVTDGVTTSPSQQFEFLHGSPHVGGYSLGTFTATATTQAFSVNNGAGSSQYNAILVAKAVTAPPTPPILGAPKLSGGNLIVTGTGGTPNAGYTWLQTTNLNAPIVWTTNSTGALDGTGAFSNSIPVIPGQPVKFLRLRLP